MKDGPWYRHSISKRVAVDVCVGIAKALQDDQYHSPNFYGYDNNKEGQFDRSVYSLVDDVRRLRAEVTEYRKLKEALKPLVREIARQ